MASYLSVNPGPSPNRARFTKPILKHPLNKIALQRQFRRRRTESAYQSLNCCLTALQHKTHLIEKMADKPSEVLRPQGEHLNALLRVVVVVVVGVF